MAQLSMDIDGLTHRTGSPTLSESECGAEGNRVVEQADPVLCQVDGQVATLTLNRPAVMNAMSGALRERFLERVETLERDPDIWVVIITGAGERAFSAGADLKERNTMS